jgi:hypothetical protein
VLTVLTYTSTLNEHIKAYAVPYVQPDPSFLNCSFDIRCLFPRNEAHLPSEGDPLVAKHKTLEIARVILQ